VIATHDSLDQRFTQFPGWGGCEFHSFPQEFRQRRYYKPLTVQ
jgi:hypothetical protein